MDFKIYDIVRVKPLDYSKVDKPTDPTALKNFTALIKKLKGFEGKIFRVVATHQLQETDFVVVENNTDKKISTGEGENVITFLADELELVDTDYMNNCCLEHINTGRTLTDDHICSTCGFNVEVFLDRYQNQTVK